MLPHTRYWTSTNEYPTQLRHTDTRPTSNLELGRAQSQLSTINAAVWNHIRDLSTSWPRRYHGANSPPPSEIVYNIHINPSFYAIKGMNRAVTGINTDFCFSKQALPCGVLISRIGKFNAYLIDINMVKINQLKCSKIYACKLSLDIFIFRNITQKE